jgi:ATP-binding cassette subfamily C protein
MRLLHQRSIEFFRYFARVYPIGTLVMVSLLLMSGLLEGISVITLVPLLEIASSPNASGEASGTGVGAMIQQTLSSFGLRPTLWTLIAVVVSAITIKAIVLWLAMRQIGYTVARVTLDLRLELLQSLARARWAYFGEQPIGEFANSISRDAVRSSAAYREGCNVLGGLLQVTAYLIVSALISWQVTVVAIVTGLVLVTGLKRFIAMGRAAGDESLALTRRLAGRLIEALQGLKPMKAMAREDALWPLLEKEAKGLNRADRRSVMAAESIKLFQEPIVAAVLGVGLVLVLDMTGSTFSAVVVLAFVFHRMMSYLNNLQNQYQFMANGEGTFWALRQQIEIARQHAELHPGTKQPSGLNEAIELRSVHFSYGDLKVLDNLSMRIPARKMTALIGGSGSGKTTILDLIIGLRRPESGDLYIDGVPLQDLDMRSWRRLIGYVPQDVFLFHETVRWNVTLGDTSISDARVTQALKDAGAWDFVARDPRGIDAIVSPQASNLSGGQRQRLAIARALARDPALIVLDEATTGLDAETEAAILQTLSALRGKVTVLAISHQPALRKVADFTLELEDGQLRSGSNTVENVRERA